MQVRDRKKYFYAWCLNVILYAMTLPFRIVDIFKTAKITQPASFLIVRLDHIGDVILSTPIYHSLKDRFPNAKITVLCGSWAAEILEKNPYVDSSIIIDCPWWKSIRNDSQKNDSFIIQLYKTILKICATGFDVFIDLRGDIRHILLFGWLTRIPKRISYTRSGGAFLLTHSYPHQNGIHEIGRNYKLLSEFEPLNKYWKPEIYTKTDNLYVLQEKLKEQLNLKNDSYAVIFNGGRSKLRRLSNNKVSELCKILSRNYFLKCCFVGDRNDFEDGEKIKKATGLNDTKFINLCGLLTLSDVKDLIKLSKLFIGTDSSICHLSASTYTPSILLFGPLNPKEVMPIGMNKKVVYHEYSCSPCLQDFCIANKSKDIAKCMEDISVEEIMQKVGELIKKSPSEKALYENCPSWQSWNSCKV